MSFRLSSRADIVYIICSDDCDMPIPVEFGGKYWQMLLATPRMQFTSAVYFDEPGFTMRWATRRGGNLADIARQPSHPIGRSLPDAIQIMQFTRMQFYLSHLPDANYLNTQGSRFVG